MPADDLGSEEDLIPVRDVVVSITEGGYSKRTDSGLYRSQRRGGRGVRGATLQRDDVVSHFFVTTTHHWILFFTNLGRVYRTKAYMLPDTARDAKGKHVANLLAFQPEERIAQVIQIKSYEDAPYLVLATRNGLVKKSRLTDFDSNRSGGIVAINLRDGDELVGAVLCSAEEDLLLVSGNGQSIRFSATDEALRPMGRATSGVTGMKFRGGDWLLSMSVVPEGAEGIDVFVVFENGLAKRTPVSDYRVQGRGGLGIQVAKLSEKGGDLVGALTVTAEDEVMVVMEKGKIVRSRVDEVRHTGRSTMGVIFATPDRGDAIVAVARNAEHGEDAEASDGSEGSEEASGADADEAPPAPTQDDGVPSDDEAPGTGADDGGDA
jgi:DNA gyrase subunit A